MAKAFESREGVDNAIFVAHNGVIRALSGINLPNCGCARAVYDTETGELSDIAVMDFENQAALFKLSDSCRRM
jgi:hypothetical protein